MGYKQAIQLNHNYKLNTETVETKILRMVQVIRFQMYANGCKHAVTLWLANQDRLQISCMGAWFINRKGTITRELSGSELAMLINLNLYAYQKIERYYNDVRTGKQIFFAPIKEESKIVVMPKRTFVQKIASILI